MDEESFIKNLTERVAQLHDNHFECNLSKLRDTKFTDTLQRKTHTAQLFEVAETELHRQNMELIVVVEKDNPYIDSFFYTALDQNNAEKISGNSLTGDSEEDYEVLSSVDFFQRYEALHEHAEIEEKIRQDFLRWSTSTKLNSKLKVLSQVVLENDFNEFQSMYADLLNLSPEQFTDKYNDWIQSIINPDQEKIDSGNISSWYFTDYRPWFNGKYEANAERFFLDFAQQRGRFAWVDWSGEDEEGEVADFVDKILRRSWNAKFEWDTAAFNEKINFDTLERGEYILLLLKAIDEKLQKQGFRLIVFHNGTDAYHYSAIPEKNAQKVVGLHWSEFYCVYTPDRIPTSPPYFSLLFHLFTNGIRSILFPLYRFYRKLFR